MALQTQKIIDLSSMPEEPSVDDTGKGISILATVDANATGIGAAMHCAADGHWEEADASADTTAPCTGLALSSGTGASKEILQQGQVRNDGWTWVTGPGEKGLIYLSITTGALTQTAPTGDGEIVQIVGHAITDDVMMFNPQLQWIELGDGPGDLHADGSVPLTANWDALDNDIRAQNLTADALTAGRLVYTGADGLLSAAAAGTWDGTTLGIDGAAVFNETGNDVDFRVESDVGTHSLFVDGATGNIGFGDVEGPKYPMDLKRAGATHYVHFCINPVTTYYTETMHNVYYSGGWKSYGGGPGSSMLYAGGSSSDAYIAFSLSADAQATAAGAAITISEAMRILKDGNVGIGTTAPGAKCHIDQSSTSGAIPVLSLDQADISDGFINFIGTSAASADGPISTWTTGNSIQGFRRIEVNGAQVWAPYYDAPTS